MRSNDFFARESSREQATLRAQRNKAFWFLIFDSGGLTFADLSAMDAADYYECLVAKELYVAAIQEKK